LQLLRALAAQDTGGRFAHSIVVADNDHLESARSTVTAFAATAPIPVSYRVEPRQNIALARNEAVAGASGDFIALIDDDEEPYPDWLGRLLATIQIYGTDGVLGPVTARFSTPPPSWVTRGGFFDRSSPPTGTPVHWKHARTGNVLLRRRIFDDPANRFRAEYGGGSEDVDFFRRALAKGMRFVWCAEAKVWHSIPPERCRTCSGARSYAGAPRTIRNPGPSPSRSPPFRSTRSPSPCFSRAGSTYSCGT
jgi:succinoglycan biosynthesis protein ExoM